MSVVIETTVGDMTVDLFIEDRPMACLNFLKLCKLKYYNFNLFHTIEQNFIAQTGDPTGAGDGGSSVWGVIEGVQKRFFEAESLPKILHTSVGLLSLVSPAKNLVGSQFFFTLADDLTSLDGQHCVIGQVVEGHETLRRLNEAIVDDKFRPYQDIRITHTVILDDPFPDMRGFRAPSTSPEPTAERLQNGRIAADEDIDDTEGKTMEEIQEMLAEREAKARATILEIVGDLPDADIAPPENVLFVCKLNSVTTDDDLEIIFSRFGKVKSCEVIRDKKTGDSLQYAFVEFEDQKACENAYFKMNNVLIDDRRIHVDFSQSVAKVKWRGKGRGVVGQQGKLDFSNLRESKKSKRDERGSTPTIEERRRAREKRHMENKDKKRSISRSPIRRHNDKFRDHTNGRRRERSPNDRGNRRYERSPDNRRRKNSPIERLEEKRRERSHEKRRERSPIEHSNEKRRERSPDNRQRNRSPVDRSHEKRRDRSPIHRSHERKREKSPVNRRIERSAIERSHERRRERSADNRKREILPIDRSEDRRGERSPINRGRDRSPVDRSNGRKRERSPIGRSHDRKQVRERSRSSPRDDRVRSQRKLESPYMKR